MKITKLKPALFALTAFMSLAVFQSCGQSTSSGENLKDNTNNLRNVVKEFMASKDTTASFLKKFDDLDFDVFSNQKWDRLQESHAKDIKVYWPDGHITQGIEVHIEDLKKLFVHAPDTRIKEHPIKFGSANYTLVTGVFEGTFTKPMPIGNGKFIQPTGKAFKMPMATVGIWKNGVMVEEHLFWDNQTYAKQIGLQ